MAARYPSQSSRLQRLREELREMMLRLIDADTERVILFGSAARGDVGSTSDLDLLIVRHDCRRPAERINDLYRRIAPRIAVDLLVYAPEEVARAQQASSFVRAALRDGEVLYDRSRPLA